MGINKYYFLSFINSIFCINESILLKALRSDPELLSRATTFDEQIGERDFEDGLTKLSEKVLKSFINT